MINNQKLLGHLSSNSDINPLDVSVLDPQTKLLAEINHLPSAEKQKNVKILSKMRNQIETDNKQLEKRVKLIKKEEQLVLDKILAGMLHEQKLSKVKEEDDKLRSTFFSIKQKENQQITIKRQKISEMKQQALQLKREKSNRLLNLKRENYLYATEIKQEALVQKKHLQLQNLNLAELQTRPKLKFKQELIANLKTLKEKKAIEQIEKLAVTESEKIQAAKEQNQILLKEQYKAYDALMKERSFHKQFFNTMFVSKRS
jgi:hypothetical protein